MVLPIMDYVVGSQPLVDLYHFIFSRQRPRRLKKGHDLLERIEMEIRQQFDKMTVTTHLESHEDPNQWRICFRQNMSNIQ
jgi:hypothetical protein